MTRQPEVALWAGTSARAEHRRGIGPCCWAERGRINPFGSNGLLDQLSHLLNPHPNTPCPCSFTWLCYACPKVFDNILSCTRPFLKDTMLICPRKVHSLPARIWHIDTRLSQEFSVSKKGSKQRKSSLKKCSQSRACRKRNAHYDTPHQKHGES